MEKTRNSLRDLFKSLFWPAAAGSVFWSFCTILTRLPSELTEPEVLSSLIILFMLTTYLSLGWLMSYEKTPSQLPAKFWIFDCIHICAIVFAALSAVENFSLLNKTSLFFFGATTVGHVVGAWELDAPKPKDRWCLAMINCAGVIIILLGDQLSINPWQLPASYVVVIAIWFIYRRRIIKELFCK